MGDAEVLTESLACGRRAGRIAVKTARHLVAWIRVACGPLRIPATTGWNPVLGRDPAVASRAAAHPQLWAWVGIAKRPLSMPDAP